MKYRMFLCLLALTALVIGLFATLSAEPVEAEGPRPAFTIPTELDLHDGIVQKYGDTYYAYGTAYGCGFQWGLPSPWCGFKVSTAPTLQGPWTTPQFLVDPKQNAGGGWNFNQLCSANTGGKGCFNPRMVKRPVDGVYVLWFNAVAARKSDTTHSYYVMGCNGPAGPCGEEAGAPYGSTHRPRLNQCNGNHGDFTIGLDDRGAVLICSYRAVLSQERLDRWYANGTGAGHKTLGGITAVEGPGVYQDPGSGKWVLTYADVNCGYCAGTGTGYAEANSLDGPWHYPRNVGWGAPADGRRLISATSCGGQARTVTVMDGQAYQGIDLWLGTRNETNAGVRYEPLVFNNPPEVFGRPWQPFQTFNCF